MLSNIEQRMTTRETRNDRGLWGNRDPNLNISVEKGPRGFLTTMAQT